MLGLYVAAKEAYEKWKSNPEKVMILDVRTPEEYLFVGHPTMAWKIPIAAQVYEWDADKGKFPMKLLADFVSRVSEVAKPDDTILVTCAAAAAAPLPPTYLPRPDLKTFTTSRMAWRGMRWRIRPASFWASAS